MAQVKTSQEKTPTRTCNQCGQESTNMKRCAQCHDSYYCNKACQQQHWPLHKANCQEKKEKIQEEKAAQWGAKNFLKLTKEHMPEEFKVPFVNNIEWVKEHKSKLDEWIVNATGETNVEKILKSENIVIAQAINHFHPCPPGCAHKLCFLFELSGKIEEDVKFAEALVIYVGDSLAIKHLRFSSNGWINDGNTGIGNAAYFALHSENALIREKFQVIYQELYAKRIATKDMSKWRYITSKKDLI